MGSIPSKHWSSANGPTHHSPCHPRPLCFRLILPSNQVFPFEATCSKRLPNLTSYKHVSHSICTLFLPLKKYTALSLAKIPPILLICLLSKSSLRVQALRGQGGAALPSGCCSCLPCSVSVGLHPVVRETRVCSRCLAMASQLPQAPSQ